MPPGRNWNQSPDSPAALASSNAEHVGELVRILVDDESLVVFGEPVVIGRHRGRAVREGLGNLVVRLDRPANGNHIVGANGCERAGWLAVDRRLDALGWRRLGGLARERDGLRL